MSNLAFQQYRSFEVEVCYKCGIEFGVLSEVRARWKETGSICFWCPNGHPQHYAEGEVQRLKRELEQKEEALRRMEGSRDFAMRRAPKANGSLRAVKGVVTKIKKRVSNGVCVCCNRTFLNLQRHMAARHPDFTKEE